MIFFSQLRQIEFSNAAVDVDLLPPSIVRVDAIFVVVYVSLKKLQKHYVCVRTYNNTQVRKIQITVISAPTTPLRTTPAHACVRNSEGGVSTS